MFCKKCGKRIPDNAPACENCGAEVLSGEIENTAEYTEEQASVNQNEEIAPDDNANVVTQEKADVKKQQTSLKDEQEIVRSEIKSKEKLKFKKSTIVIGIVSIVLCIALIIVTFPYIKNAFAKLFMSSEDYFAYVVKNNSEDTAKSISNTLDDLKNSTLNGASSTGSMNIEFEEPFHEVIADVTGDVQLGGQFHKLLDMAGISVSSMVGWIDEVSLDYNVKSDGKNQQSAFKLDINDASFGRIDVVNGKDKGVTYIGLPDYNDVYFSSKADEKNSGSYSAVMQSAEKVVTALPEKELTEEIIIKYIECFAENVGDVKETGKTVHAGEFSKKITSLSAEIDKGEMKTITENLLDELKKDKDIKEIIRKIADSSDMSDDEIMASVEDALNEMNRFYSDDLNREITLEIFVDAKGKIIGMKISNDKFEFSNCTITKWFEICNEINGKIGMFSFNLAGKGKLSDNMVNLNYNLEVMGSKMATIEIRDLDYKKLKEGLYDTRATVDFDKSISKIGSMIFNAETENSVGAKLVKLLPDVSLELDISQKSDVEMSVAAKINHKDELCVTVDIANKNEEKKKVTLPENHIDVGTEDIIKVWTDTFDDEKFFDFLEEAGVPNVGILKTGYRFLF